MAITITDGWHKQLMDLDSFEEVSPPGVEELQTDNVAGGNHLFAQSVNRFPSIVDVHLSAEEVNTCWRQARKLGGDKHKIQSQALRLIAELSRTKQQRIEEEEAEMVKKARSEQTKKRVVRRKVKPTDQPKASSGASGVIRLDVEEEDVFSGIEVTVKFANGSVTTTAEKVMDDQETVIIRIGQDYSDHLLPLKGVKKSSIVELNTWDNDTQKFGSRKVLANPIRFKDDNVIYIIFICVPDGV